MKRKKYTMRPVNPPFVIGLALILTMFASVSCYFAYQYEVDRAIARLDVALDDLYDAYEDNAYSFSEIYEPIFETESSRLPVYQYFSREGGAPLDAMGRAALAGILERMILRDNDVEWIALYNPGAKDNYYMGRGDGQLSALPADFPYAAYAGNARYRLHGALSWRDANGVTRANYTIQGGALPSMQNGCVFVGYSAYALQRIANRALTDTPVTFLITAGDAVAFDSGGAPGDANFDTRWMGTSRGIHRDASGQRWYTNAVRNDGRGFSAAYMAPWRQFFAYANRNTAPILLILAGFALFALGLYAVSSRRMVKRVSGIRRGLLEIGEGRLEYRLALSSRSDEFDEISESINTMASLIQKGMEKEYELRLKQVRLQLNQIQARFNPHFLYNTLEMIRGRLFERGDLETADFIEKLSRIFRNLTSARTVVTIREEISFCSLYLALLQMRFRDSVNVYYDIAPELQNAGILSNLIQPAIENYFVHALGEACENNELGIACQPYGEDRVQIVIADNGMGLPASRMEEINRQLANPAEGLKGYGLQSIASRIRLFYGEGYGVRISQNENGGAKVTIVIPRLSPQAHEEKLVFGNIKTKECDT